MLQIFTLKGETATVIATDYAKVLNYVDPHPLHMHMQYSDYL